MSLTEQRGRTTENSKIYKFWKGVIHKLRHAGKVKVLRTMWQVITIESFSKVCNHCNMREQSIAPPRACVSSTHNTLFYIVS